MAAVTRAARISAGMSMLAAGCAMLLLPGPGLLTIAGALSVLARDVPVARRVLDAAVAWFPRRRVSTVG